MKQEIENKMVLSYEIIIFIYTYISVETYLLPRFHYLFHFNAHGVCTCSLHLILPLKSNDGDIRQCCTIVGRIRNEKKIFQGFAFHCAFDRPLNTNERLQYIFTLEILSRLATFPAGAATTILMYSAHGLQRSMAIPFFGAMIETRVASVCIECVFLSVMNSHCTHKECDVTLIS
jgi:hypothetical protein